MIIGTITLLTLLFGSGSFELFFLPDFENAVKVGVVEKDRQKEILVDLKESNQIFKDFNKERQSDNKRFEELNLSRLSKEADFTAFFAEIQEKRISMQNDIIDSRIAIVNKIEPSEWDSIVVFSNTSVANSIEKAQKKSDKKSSKEPEEKFKNTLKTISQVVVEPESKKNISEEITRLKNSFDKLSNNLETTYENKKSVIAIKGASKSDLLNITEELNNLRNLVYEELVIFHMVVKKNTNEEDWKKIMKAFNKEMTLTNR